MAATTDPPATGQRTIDDQEVLPPLEEIRVDGTTQLSAFDAGGKRPHRATLTIKGGSAKIVLNDGQAFKKGDRIGGEWFGVVREVAQVDKADKQTGIVTECEQKHVAVILDLRVVHQDLDD